VETTNGIGSEASLRLREGRLKVSYNLSEANMMAA